MHYANFISNRFISNERLFLDAESNYIADVNECVDKIESLSGPFPIEVVRNKDFLEIILLFNGTYKIYETYTNGRGMCKVTTVLEKPSKKWNYLKDVHPECEK